MALAGLVAVLAIPFLVIDSSSTAEGVVESVAPDEVIDAALPAEDPSFEIAEAIPAEAAPAPVTTEVVRPDVMRLAGRAASWTAARQQAIEEGTFVPIAVAPPSNTDLALLPVVSVPTTEQPKPVDPTSEPEPVREPDPEPDPTVAPTPTTDLEPADPAPDPEPEPETPDDPAPPADPVPDPEPALETPDDPAPPEDTEPDPKPVDPPTPRVPDPPAQVDGRVPPPAGGPSAAAWDAVRRCESTHNYRAISVSGLYRGAYQFSQQTWDWVASIHYPYLVGIDPIDAAPGWQDVMAYTLYAMRGWDQWPICGKHLL